ncbi:uncharacterized protein LOC129216284 [Uloborus diversus]|uniref:uncharacterized protein LOC129216284 n=1 Tax=Uloborus diversus TaxID=327109 RepID=UPI00240A5609|nr:uncharacterized protein LOC129216284 [Uloborus diversus]
MKTASVSEMITPCDAAGHKLFMNERDSDISIKVEWEGNRWHFPAHSLVLSAMSEVFRIMFHIDMEEKNNKEVVIVDSSPLAVKQFLKYLYTGIINCSEWTEEVNVLKIAHKYGVQTLINQCENHLVTDITISNACALHDLAVMYNLLRLRSETEYFILEVGFIVSCTEGFLSMKAKSLEYFLNSYKFNMENEAIVLKSLKEWAKNECSKKSLPLTHTNILATMEPFLKYIRWNHIPPNDRKFIPKNLIEKHRNFNLMNRRPFRVSPVHQYHVNTVKFVVELGAFCNNTLSDSGFNCLRFGVDNHVYISGFKIISMFRTNCSVSIGTADLILKRVDNKFSMLFNLQSLPWNRGANTGEYVWREMFAYFPYPIRIDPFHTYVLNVKCGTLSSPMAVKWPSTKLEIGLLPTELGPINFFTYGSTFGITQLFLFPAPPFRPACNDIDS